MLLTSFNSFITLGGGVGTTGTLFLTADVTDIASLFDLWRHSSQQIKRQVIICMYLWEFVHSLHIIIIIIVIVYLINTSHCVS